MTKFFTNDFKQQAIEALLQSSPAYYVFLGRHTPYTDDSNPPPITQNTQEMYVDVYDQMVSAKRIKPSDMVQMVPRVDWMSGIVYPAYEHDAVPSLYGRPFYVTVFSGSTYDVFKCLNNNRNSPSTVAPSFSSTSPDDDVYETSDGYQWKYMYSIFEADFRKFASIDYMPVYSNANVVSAAVNGSIDFVKVTYGGSGYDSYTSGLFQSINVAGNNQVFWIESSASANNNFYNGCALKVTSGVGAGQQRSIIGYSVSGSTRTVVLDRPFDVAPTTSSTYDITPAVVITGSGNGFVGRALVNAASSNSIYKVEITNRGQGYVYGDVTLSGNVGSISNTATFKPMISPPGGHGSDPATELGSKYLGISVTFNTADVPANGKLFDTNDFRVIGIVNAPLLANLVINYTGANGAFVNGETITQRDTNATGIVVTSNASSVTLTSATGNFLPGNSTFREIVGLTSGIAAEVITTINNGSNPLTEEVSYVNQLTFISTINASGAFAEDEMVVGTGANQNARAYVYSSNSSGLLVSNMRGEFGNTIIGTSSGSTATVTQIRPGDFIRGSGKVVYIENISPINKNVGQTETIKAVIEF